MELRINIEANQIIGLIKQMPSVYRLKIKEALEKTERQKKLNVKDTRLTELLLSGPVISSEEIKNFKTIQKFFDLWTKNAFA